MMKLPISKLIGSLTHIVGFQQSMNEKSIDSPNTNIEYPLPAFIEILENVESFCISCKEIGLATTFEAAKAFQIALYKQQKSDGSGFVAANDVALLGNYATVVTGCLFHESATKVAISIPPERAKYFEPKAPLFGDMVFERFPAAAQDIEDAGRCLAFGQGTATVMHLMRVLEVGLKALAFALQIPYAQSWETYLTQIQKQIAGKHASKSLKWKKSEKFYRDSSGDLMTIKQAWRNPTMHVDRKYYADEAEVIFGATKTFMQRLAEKLPAQKSKKKPIP
jgi:hypothetical protein